MGTLTRGSSHHMTRVVLILMISALLISSCKTPSTGEDEAGEGNLTSQQQALGSDDPGTSGGEDDMGLSALACPTGPDAYQLKLNHTFNFSPGRLTEKMKIDGHTTPDAWCLVTVTGKKLEAEDCVVDYNFQGYFIGDDGTRCDISGSSTALISLKGECLEGKDNTVNIYLEITETGDPDSAAVGTLNCPGYSPIAFASFYPPSYFIADFPVNTSPRSDTDNGPDLTGQFEYTKVYTLIPPPLAP